MSSFPIIVETELQRLESAQLVRRAEDIDPSYSFKHTLTQETAYTSLLQKRRRKVHLLVAQAYELNYADSLAQHAAVLAQHYSQAADDAKTLIYATIAGDEAARIFASEEAIANYSLALASVKKVEDQAQTEEGTRPSSINPSEDFSSAVAAKDHSALIRELYLKRGRAMELNNRHNDALSNYKEMESVGERRSDQSIIMDALVAQAVLHSIPSPAFDVEKGQDLSDRALVLAREMGDRKSEAKILWSKMLLGYFTNNIEGSVTSGEKSVAISREMNLREQLAITLSDLARSYMAAGQTVRALETQTEARALLRELGNLPLLADNLTNSAGVHFNRGELDISISLAEEALGIARSIGNVWGEVYAEQMLSSLSMDKGDVGEALVLLEQSLKSAEQIGAMFAIPIGYSFRGWVYGRLGDRKNALDSARLGVSKGETLFPPFLPLSYAMLAFALLINGDTSGAGHYIEKSHENFDPRNFDFPQPFFVALIEAEIALAKGEPGRALKLVDDLIANAESMGFRAMKADALHMRGRALEASSRLDEAYVTLQAARREAESSGERSSLLQILAALARHELRSGNLVESSRLRSDARTIAEAIATGLTPELRSFFLKLPDVAFVLSPD